MSTGGGVGTGTGTGTGDSGGGTGAGTDTGGAVPWASVAEGQTWQIGNTPWYETAIPDGPARELARAKKYAHPGVMATSYAELERINASRDDSKMIRIPDANAKPEDWNAVYEKLGRPKDVNGYGEVKWGENADPGMVEFGKSLAFKLGLSPKAVEGIMVTEWNNFVNKANTAAAEKLQQDGAAAVATIRSEWKGDFDANIARGKQVLTALGNAGFGEADMAAVEQHIGIAPVIKLLATIGKLSGEGKFMDGTGGGTPTDPSVMTSEQAKAEITRLTGDANFQKTFLGRTEPGHAEAVARMEKLYAKAGALARSA